MQNSDGEQYRDDLLIELIANWLQFDALSEQIPGPNVNPPYLLVGVAVFIEYGVFDLYNYFISGNNSFIVEPKSLTVPAMVILGVFGAQYVHDTYSKAISQLRIEERNTSTDPDLFERLLSMRIRIGFWILAVIVTKLFELTVLGFNNIIAVDGIGLFLYSQIAFPLVYIPVLVEFALAYFSVHILVPRRIANIGLFFHDPRNMGGFKPIGELLKRSYYLYTSVLVLYFVQTKIPVLFSEYVDPLYQSPTAGIENIVLTIGWGIGVLTIAYSMSRIHKIMKSEKEQRILELESELTDYMDSPFDIHAAEVTNEEQYEMVQTRLSHVRDTKTYPTTFTMWSQILISVILPQALSAII